MQVSVSDAEGQLIDLVRRAEAGEDIVLTHQGEAAARLVAVRPAADRNARLAFIKDLQRTARAKLTPGPDAARSQDFLYGADGLPD